MATLLIRCVGPMQSWGYKSAFELRNTQPEPTKSGIIGLLCAALGRDRSEPLTDLTALKMGVRVEAAGVLAYDYQTALAVAKADGSRPDTQTSQRGYLSDAAFWVGLEGQTDTLKILHKALLNPVWPIFLGRKSYLPSIPVVANDVTQAISESSLAVALKQAPHLGANDSELRKFILECGVNENPTNERDDVPVSFVFDRRTFTSRYIKETWEAADVPE